MYLSLLSLIPLLFPKTSFASADLKYYLDGSDWTVTNATMPKPIQATVPGDIYTDLLSNNLINDPYYGWNAMNYQWIAFTNWTYSKTFNITSKQNNTQLLTNRVLQLVCDGLDTKATVFINNQLIFTNDNMYQRNIINLNTFGTGTSILNSGINTITVIFESKPVWATNLGNTCNDTIDTAGQCPTGCVASAQEAPGFCDVNFIRTEPCSFSWDWGPAFAPVGVWKSIYLHSYDTAVVRDVLIYASAVDNATNSKKMEKMSDKNAFFAKNNKNIGNENNTQQQRKDSKNSNKNSGNKDKIDKNGIYRAMNDRTDNLKDYTTWDTQIVVFVDSGITDAINVATASMSKEYGKSKYKKKGYGVGKRGLKAVTGTVHVYFDDLGIEATQEVTLERDSLTNVSVTVPRAYNIEAWMPNGFGTQTLYGVRVYFETNDTSTTELSMNFGFREVELVQNPLPSGKSFYFRVNGIPIPVHGSNWIPSDAFESRVNRTTLTKNFIALRDSHQNMIRNWGGGIYQHTEFYDLADEYGIMIWEDMMWACNTYWVLPSYLQSSAKEIIDNVKRIQYHPSIAIWAGNNENGCTANTDSATYYTELYFYTILNNITALDTSRPMVVSSPSNGNETAQEPCSNSYSPYFGDLHLYLYGADCWNVSVFTTPRFMSEFGLQSWPAYATLKNYFPQTQQNWTSPLMTNRNHHPSGQLQIEELIKMHYNTPDSDPTTDVIHKWKKWLFLTQMYQAYCYKVEVEYLRSVRYDCSENNPGCTMGTMYWQTNDIWPGASWSSVDYDGRYKASQYFAQHFYRQLIVIGYSNGTDYLFYGINDDPDSALTNATLEFIVYSFKTSNVQSTWTVGNENNDIFNIDASGAQLVYQISIESFVNKTKCDSTLNDCILTWNVKDKEGDNVSDNWMFLESPKNTVAKKSSLNIVNVFDVSDSERRFVVSYNVSELAVFVWLECDVNGYFDNNGMIRAPGSYNETFRATVDSSVEEIKSSLVIESLYEAYGFANASYVSYVS